MPDVSTNAALAAAGYTTADSPSYGLKRVLKDGIEVGHFDAVSAWTLPGMREVRDQPITDIERDLAALLALGGNVADTRRTGSTVMLDTFDAVCVLANRSGRPLDCEGLTIALRLIKAGATNAEAVLADVRAELSNAQFEAAV